MENRVNLDAAGFPQRNPHMNHCTITRVASPSSIHTVLCGLLITCHCWCPPAAAAERSPDEPFDVVVYGGTSGAVIAALRAAMLGADVVIVSPDKRLGGLTSGGLGYTDSGKSRAIGGLAREFYRRVWKHYQRPEAWKWQPRDTFRVLGQGVKEADTVDNSMWLFEPHVAERIFEHWLAEHEIEVVREARLDRERGVELAPAANGSRARCSSMRPTKATSWPPRV